MAANWRNSPEGIARSLGQSTTTNTNSSSTSRKPQVTPQNSTSKHSSSKTSASTSLNGSTGNSRMDTIISAVKQNVENAKSGNTEKTTVTEAMRDNSSKSNTQSSSTTTEKTTNLSGGTILGSIIADKPTQTVTESMRNNSSSTTTKKENTQTEKQKTTSESTVGHTKQSSTIESVIPAVSTTPKQQTETEKTVSESLSNVFESKKQQIQEEYNPADFAVGGKKATSEAPKFTGEFNYEHSISNKNDLALVSNQQIAHQIYRDEELVGIHFFDSKAESEKFLKELYPQGNYDWRDREVKWYDTKTGAYIGDLGQTAYPYAAFVGELSDQEVILFHNTGGIKGNSPSTGTGLSSWTDVPSAKTRHELRNEFDFTFSSKNLDYNEIQTQLERQGIDSTWYDGKVGQNSGKTNLSISDAKAGKITTSDYRNEFGSANLANIEGYEIHVLPTTSTTTTTDSLELKNAYQNADGTFSYPSQDNTILNNPFELIGTLAGVGAVAKMAGIGSKIANDVWISTAGKVMDGFKIIDTPARNIIGGGTARTAGKQTSEFVTTKSGQMKLAEIGLGIGGVGIFAGKELDNPSNFFEIIPQNIVSSEIESPSKISGLNEIIPSEYHSELEVPTESSNKLGLYAGSVVLERVKEKEKTKTKNEKEFSYGDIPSYTDDEKIRFAKEAYEKQRQQEIKYEKEQSAKQKEQELTIEKESEFVFIGEQEKPVISEIVSDGITKTNEKNKHSDIVREKYEEKYGLVFDYPIKEKYNLGLKGVELVANKEKYIPKHDDSFENVNNVLNTNPFVYNFGFGFDQQNEDKRRRRLSDSDKSRAGKYRMNHYRLFHNIATAEEMGLGLREVNPNKSRKIGFENVEWVESGSTRSTRKNTTLFADSWDKSSFFEPVTRKRRKTTTKKNRKRRK